MRNVRIRSLLIEDLAEANALIHASKAFWKEDPQYLSAALKVLSLNPASLSEMALFGLCDEDEGDLLGVFGIATDLDEWKLEHLWIRPACMGQGLGEMAMAHVKHLAKCRGIQGLRILPEPQSEGFYTKIGAEFTGNIKSSRIAGGPNYREMRLDL